MLRAPDGHAKNFSIQLLACAGGFKLTPFYVVDKVRADLPAGFSEKVADKILSGLLDAASPLERMEPG